MAFSRASNGSEYITSVSSMVDNSAISELEEDSSSISSNSAGFSSELILELRSSELQNNHILSYLSKLFTGHFLIIVNLTGILWKDSREDTS